MVPYKSVYCTGAVLLFQLGDGLLRCARNEGHCARCRIEQRDLARGKSVLQIEPFFEQVTQPANDVIHYRFGCAVHTTSFAFFWIVNFEERFVEMHNWVLAFVLPVVFVEDTPYVGYSKHIRNVVHYPFQLWRQVFERYLPEQVAQHADCVGYVFKGCAPVETVCVTCACSEQPVSDGLRV